MNITFLLYDSESGGSVANQMIVNGAKGVLPGSSFYVISSKGENSYGELISSSPDIIILQDFFPSEIALAYRYKKEFPLCKILLFTFSAGLNDPHAEVEIMNMLGSFDQIFLPYRRALMPIQEKLHNVSNYYPPLELSRFAFQREWNSRIGGFCEISRLISSKISPHALEDFSRLHITFDFFASSPHRKYAQEHWRLADQFRGSAQCRKALPHGSVASMLNNYRYHYLEASDDCFSIITLEAFACGAIPVIIADENKSSIEMSWIPEGFGFVFHTVDEFFAEVQNLLIKDNSLKARRESIYMRNKYNYGEFYKTLSKWVS